MTVATLFTEHCILEKLPLLTKACRIRLPSVCQSYLNISLVSFHFETGVIFVFSLKVWEVLNLFWPWTIIKSNIYTENTETALKIWEFLIPPVGRETQWVRVWAAVMKTWTHLAPWPHSPVSVIPTQKQPAWGGGACPAAWLIGQSAALCPGHPSALAVFPPPEWRNGKHPGSLIPFGTTLDSHTGKRP